MIHCLVDVAKKKGADDRVKQYWNSWHCANKVRTAKGRIYTHYCKNRCCTVCCAIRKAEMINKYLETISTWSEPQLVTLTLKSVPAKKLRPVMQNMLKCLRLIINKQKKRDQRGTGKKLVGVRSLESNFNPQTKKYNPHFHLIVAEKWMAKTLVSEWLQRAKNDYSINKVWVSKRAQHIRPVGSTEHDMIEIVKYGSKIFTEHDLKKKGNWKLPPMIYAAALDEIFAAMKGLRIFERFGFSSPPQARQAIPATYIEDYQDWHYDLAIADWVNYDTGELLTGYTRDPKLANILGNNINTELR